MHPKLEPQALEPVAVSLLQARELLGGKSRSAIYEELGRGRLVGLKDGSKTLIVLSSIKAYMAALPLAKIRPPKPRSPHSDRRRRGK